ncbi:Protein of unknown function (DUF668) [Abeliophyllum distichum]|uniref:DUF668 domain-containing protein n=1 Tax=Abeliophyllum distichum TaxID=126358 RepID=A0ABD1RFR1_9LAMI
MTIKLNVVNVNKQPYDNEEVAGVDMIEALVDDSFVSTNCDNALKMCLMHFGSYFDVDSSINEVNILLESVPVMDTTKWKQKIKPLPTIEKKNILSVQQPPKLELKALSDTLQYAFLGEDNTLPVIISSFLNDAQKELEQSLRRKQAGAGLGQVKLLEFQQKVVWQRQEVKNLRETSPWVRTYDFVVRLLLRSIITIIERLKHVYGINHIENVEGINHYERFRDDCLTHNNSISALLQLPISPSENNMSRFPGPFGRSFSNLGLSRDKNRSRNKKLHARSLSSLGCGKQLQTKSRRFDPVGPFKGCMTGGSDSPVVQSYTPSSSGFLRSNGASQRYADETKDTNAVPILHSSITSSKVSFFNYKRHLLNAPPSTLGYAALALHYANIIILIEKLASSPHLISLDARDDLYNMLPASIRTCLRAKLKLFSKTSASCVYDAAFAANWSLAVSRILEWLSPLAHNMIRWYSERNFEKQQMVSRTNVLLVQTLYFANQAETEAAIVELLMGLNYLSRFAQDITEKPFRESSCSRGCDGNMFPKDRYYYNMIHHTSSEA